MQRVSLLCDAILSLIQSCSFPRLLVRAPSCASSTRTLLILSSSSARRGVTDSQSWLNFWPVKSRTAFPLPFNRDYSPKPPFDVLIGLCDHRR